MSKSGPQRYPGASTRYWFQSRYGGDAMESNVGVLHTTEGTSVPGYGGGAVAPNFTAAPDIGRRRLVWFQHFDFDVSARALENRAGGVETNTMNALQVELVGTCDPAHRRSWGSQRAGRDYLYWPDAPDWALAELGAFVRWAHDHHGIKMQSGVDWRAYPASYGNSPARMSGAQWLSFYGWCGHQHVPENAHGDPGDLDMARVLEHAKGAATAAREDDDVALSDDDVERIAEAAAVRFWNKDIIAYFKTDKDNQLRQPENWATDVWGRLDRVERGVKQLAARGAAQDAALARLADGGGITAEQIQAAAEAGARAALAELGEDLTEEH
ncbi:MAG TPA: hypothetical protein VFH77_09385 [Streptomyces sp.]|nr:hypothetical protein [Streptomyces sp.]